MLGSNLVRMLLEKKYEVSVFLFSYSRSHTLEGLNVKRFFGDVTIPETLDEAFKNQDVIIHTAASTSVFPSRSEIVRKINIEGTQNVINKVLQFQNKKLIYVGSASSVNTKPSESQKYVFPGAKFRLDYIDTKYHALQLVLKSVKEDNLPATAILPTFMIGAYDSVPGSGKLILKYGKGKIRFYTGGGRNFVHVKDVANAIIASFSDISANNTNGKYFVIGNENLSYKEFFALISKLTGIPEPKIKIPDWGVKSFGFISEMVGKITRKEPMLSYPMARVSCEKQFIETDSAEELNIIRTPVKIAVEDCYQWFVQNNYVAPYEK